MWVLNSSALHLLGNPLAAKLWLFKQFLKSYPASHCYPTEAWECQQAAVLPREEASLEPHLSLNR